MPSLVAFVPSLARTTSGQSPALTIPAGASDVGFLVDVTAAGGVGPSLALSVQWSNDGAVWADAEPADTFAAVTAAKTVVKRFPVKADMCRLVWTLTGTTPSFTFVADVFLAELLL